MNVANFLEMYIVVCGLLSLISSRDLGDLFIHFHFSVVPALLVVQLSL